MTLIYNHQTQSQNSYISQTFTYLHSSIPKIMQLALPALGMIALSYIPMANAGQKEFDYCVATCTAMAMSSGITLGMPYEKALEICQLSCSFCLIY